MAFVRALTEASEALGLDPRVLLQGSPFALEDLSAPLQPIERPQLDALVERAVALTGEPAIGLRRWREPTFGTFGAVGHAIAGAASFRAGLGLIERYGPLFMNEPWIEVQDDAALCIVRFRRTSPSLTAHRAYVEASMFALARLLRQCAGVGGLPRVVRLDYAAPPHHAQYAAALGCRCDFRAERAELVVASVHAHQPNLNHAEALSRELCAMADGLLARRAQRPLATRVLERWRASGEISRMSMEETAAQFGMSDRALRRRLHAEGTSFPALVQRALAELAERLLRDPSRSLAEIALTLGFEDPRAFQQALRRWTGKTPCELRGSAGPSVSEPRRARRRVPDQSGMVPILRVRQAE
jgi:AraC-like DNA-binding protein